MKALIGDSWRSLLSGLGVRGRDPAVDMQVAGRAPLTWGALENLYRFGGVAARIVDLPAAEEVRQWIEIEGDKDGLISDALDDLRARPMILQARKWARLYGGSVMVIGAGDGRRLDQPLSEVGLRRVAFLRVYPARDVDEIEVDDDPTSPGYGEPMGYRVTPMRGGSFTVHRSRCIVFDGVDVSPRQRIERRGFGDSVYERVLDDLRRDQSTQQYVQTILRDFNTGRLGINGLGDMIAAGNEETVRKRIDAIDLSRSVLNTMVIDADGETYEKVVGSVTGLPDVMDRFAERVCAATGIPMTLLYGRAPAGLNATGASDVRFFYDTIRAAQEDELRGPIERLVRLMQIAKDGPTKGKELDGWRVHFRPLWQLDEKEEAARREVIAKTDALYVQAGVVDPEEVAETRFGGDKYDDGPIRRIPDADLSIPDLEPEEEMDDEAPPVPAGG